MAVGSHYCPVHHTCSVLSTYLSGPELHIFEKNEDEMKTMMMITTRKTIVYHGNVMTAMIWTL